jgi:hypothetical protein
MVAGLYDEQLAKLPIVNLAAYKYFFCRCTLTEVRKLEKMVRAALGLGSDCRTVTIMSWQFSQAGAIIEAEKKKGGKYIVIDHTASGLVVSNIEKLVESAQAYFRYRGYGGSISTFPKEQTLQVGRAKGALYILPWNQKTEFLNSIGLSEIQFQATRGIYAIIDWKIYLLQPLIKLKRAQDKEPKISNEFAPVTVMEI